MAGSQHTAAWKLLAIGSTLLLCLLGGITLFCPHLIDDQRWRSAALQPEPSSFAYEYHRQLRALAAQAAPDRLMLVGDSQFHQFDTNRFSHPVLNFAIGGDTIRNMSQRLPDYDYTDRASAIVIWGGINDFARGRSAHDILADYTKLLAQMPEYKRIIVLGIPPTAKRSAGQNFSNVDLRNFNQALANICKINCEFIDLFPLLTGTNGELAPEFDAGDGLHLTGKAHQLVAQLIEQKLDAKKVQTL